MTVLKEMIIRYETDGRIVKGFDAGELIRCKDCKSRSKVPCKDIFGENLYRCYFHECVVRDGDFCSFADRKVAEMKEDI
jgi:hypothetical protein